MSSESQPERLAALCDDARAAGRIALDTEFMGEGRYRTLLCLIQLAVPTDDGGHRVEVVDPLAQELDGAPIADVLADPAIQVVVHAGRQDIALVRRRFASEVRNVFDTQVAGAFVGLGAQVSYESLLADALGVRLAKSASFTRWDTRPLSPEQLAYAREDAVHLLELAAELETRLRTLGRLQWAREECEPLERSSDDRDPAIIFARLPRIRSISPSAQAIARELIDWRERTAERVDRPAQSILSDPALMEIARRKPASSRELQQIRGAGGNAGRRAEELLAAVRRGRDRQTDALAHERRPPPPRREDAPLVALAEALLRARALEAGLAYELLAARADLQAIVEASRAGDGDADVRTLRGWRRELVGNELLALLAGEVSLSVHDRQLRVVR